MFTRLLIVNPHIAIKTSNTLRLIHITLSKLYSGAHLAGGGGGEGGPWDPDHCPFLIQSKLCPQILKPI